LEKQFKKKDKEKKQKLDGIISQIVELDKEHIRVIKHLQKTVMSTLRDTRSGQRLNQAYAHPY
jgi:hypothetical protein